MTGEWVNDDAEAVLIAYGSNLSPDHVSASQAFHDVVKALRKTDIRITKVSSLWRSAAWPDPSHPPYHNAVMQVNTCLEPFELMELLHDIENTFGRTRTRIQNAPRTVDLDLIAYGNRIMSADTGLILPHPRAADRGFVMRPLAEICPEWVHPVLGRTARDLAQAVTVAADARLADPA